MDVELMQFANLLTGWFRKQQTLIAKMHTACPKLTIHWIVFGKLSSWHLANHVQMQKFLIDKNIAAKTPLPEWWIILADVNQIIMQFNMTYVTLQGCDLIVTLQGFPNKSRSLKSCNEYTPQIWCICCQRAQGIR